MGTKNTFCSPLPSAVSYLLLVFSLLVMGGNCWCLDAEISQLNTASSLDFAPDNLVLLSTDSTANVVNFWRIDTKELIYTYYNANSPVSAKFSKDGAVVGVGLANGDVVILNYNGLSIYTANNTLTNPASGAVVEIDFSWMTFNSMIVCSASRIKFINFITGVSPWTFNGNGSIFSCKLNKLDGIGYSYGRNAAWNNYNSAPTAAIDQANGGSSNTYFEVDFSMDTTVASIKLVSGNADNNYYSLPNGCNNNANNIFSVSNNGYAVCYSKDNNFIAGGETGGSGSKLYIFNTSGTVYQKFDDSNMGFSHCRFSYNTKYLAASSVSTPGIYIYTTNCFLSKCKPGFYSNNGVCLTCSTITACLTCSAAATCTSCNQGFYLNSNACASCTTILNCRSCESSTKCTECTQGFFLSNASSCIVCESLLNGCLSCSRNYTNVTATVVSCRTCHSEYYLNSSDSTCYPCAKVTPQCMRCYNSSLCMECQMGYYLDGTFACQQCTGSCITCTNSTNCIVCTKGFYSVGGVCTSCGLNCLDCYNTGTCVSCAKGTFISSGACTACAAPCLTCNSTAGFCLSCANNYFLNGAGSCLLCTNNCDTCSSASNCSSCVVGYYLTPTYTCSICSALFPNCTTCNSAQCFSCQSSFYLNSTNCQTCLSSLNACLACSNSTFCSQCFVGYYLNASGTCSVCPAQCESCSSASSCVSCAVGYYSTPPTCTPCALPCATCTSSSNCVSCQTGHYLNTSVTPNVCTMCLLSLIGCTACSSASNCIECEIGRYLSGSTCLFCPSNCSTCNDTACLACSVGYYLTGSSCSMCLQNCSECSSASVCHSCNVGFYLNTSLSNNNCLPCIGLGCETCNINGCLSCQMGFYLSSSSCLTCNSSFSNCISCSESQCLQCMYGFYSNAGVCALCFDSLDGCVSCMSNAVCVECTAGYYLTGASICSFCPIQCKTCVNSVCTSCQAQYIFNLGATDCVLCESYIDACLTCSSTSVCTTCYEGFYLSGNVCLSCRTNLLGCLSCSNATVCSLCQDEYYLLNGVCTTCTSIQACSNCQNSSICLSCLSGYYLNTNNTCSLCTASLVGCLFCASSNTCRECQSGYFLNSGTNQCQMCINSLVGCLSCSNSSICTECDGGFYLDAASLSCKSCNVTGCQVCGDSSPGVCVSCSLGYYLTGTTCTACSQSACLECSAAAVCLRCDSGYYLSGTLCVSCKPALTACSKCLNGSVCRQCDSTFFLNSSNLCQSCSDTLASCEMCSSASYCTACSSGYYASGGVCTSCSTIVGCFMCLSSSNCLSCLNGYYLSASTCHTCASSLANCYSCSNSSVCLSCLSGYVLDSSGVCNAVVAGTATAPLPIPMLAVKTYYVSSTALKHVFYTKQGYKFTHQSLSWSSVTTISMFNSASSSTVGLTITSVEWAPTSIIFYTNNPLNLNADALAMPLTRLLPTQEQFSFSYQTKFQMTQAALALLMPDVVIPNDFTQQTPLMTPSFYISYLQNGGEFYYSIIGFVIIATLFVNFVVRATCTASGSRNIGEIVPHIMALKTCVLMVFPIYPQVASFCYGIMGADLVWFSQYYVPGVLAYQGDLQPAGFQLFYSNMNFASLYLTSFLLSVLLLLLAFLSRSRSRQEDVFSLSLPQQEESQNKSSSAFMRVVFLYFSFGTTFAGAASIQGALYNPTDFLSANGACYMLGSIVFCVQLAVTIFLTRRESRSCYIRSFLKAALLSAAHVSPMYICTLAVGVDIALMVSELKRFHQWIKFPRVWAAKHLAVNLSLLLLYYLNSKKLALLAVIAISLLSTAAEVGEHLNEGSIEEAPSKRIKPVTSEKDRLSDHDDKNETVQFFSGDIKNGKEAELIEPPFGDTKTTIHSLAYPAFVFDEDSHQDTLPISKKSPHREKRHRPFRTMQRKRSVKIEPILEKDDSFESSRK